MTDEVRPLDACRIEQRPDPVGHRFDRRQDFARAAAVSGQVRGEHTETVVREPAALQHPAGMILPRAVDEDDGGLSGQRLAREVSATVMKMNAISGNRNVHDSGPCGSGEAAIQVFDQIVRVFESDREANGTGMYARRAQLRIAHAGVRRGGRMDEQRFGIASARQMREHFERFDELHARRASAREMDVQHRRTAARQ